MLLKLQEFIDSLPTSQTNASPVPPTLFSQLSCEDIQFKITHSTQEIKGHIGAIINIPDIGIITKKDNNLLWILN